MGYLFEILIVRTFVSLIVFIFELFLPDDPKNRDRALYITYGILILLIIGLFGWVIIVMTGFKFSSLIPKPINQSQTQSTAPVSTPHPSEAVSVENSEVVEPTSNLQDSSNPPNQADASQVLAKAILHLQQAKSSWQQGNKDAAIQHAQTALELRKSVLGPNHQLVKEVEQMLANTQSN